MKMTDKMSKGIKMKKEALILALLLPVLPLTAQPQRLTLDDCREMALKADKDLQQARTRIEMAGYDRKIALANYFPTVSATGAYLYNNRDIALVDEFQSSMLQSAGSIMQGVMEGAAASMEEQISGAMSQAMTGTMTQLMTAIQTNPALAQEYMSSLRRWHRNICPVPCGRRFSECFRRWTLLPLYNFSFRIFPSR